ncbi:MAG: hypothetical protein N3D17_06665 [bacterium]|nr:hypothetical protein [bacterium]
MTERVLDITGVEGAKYIIDTAGDEELFQNAFSMLAEDGKISLYKAVIFVSAHLYQQSLLEQKGGCLKVNI